MAYTAKFYEKEGGVLFFHLLVPSTADRNVAPFEFDGPATPSHLEGYKNEYRTFVENKKAVIDAMIEARVEEALENKISFDTVKELTAAECVNDS